MSIDTLYTSLTTIASSGSTDTLEVQITKKDQIDLTLPDGVPISQVESALMSSLSPPCNASCAVVYLSSAGRRLQSESGTFEATWQFGAESAGSLDASTVNASALAENIGVSVISSLTLTVLSVEARVVIVTEGTIASAQSVVTEQQAAFTPSALASAMGLSASAFTSTTTAMAPPLPPPSPSSLSPPLSSNQSSPLPPAYMSPVVLYESTNDYLLWIVFPTALLISCVAFAVSFYIKSK